MIEFLAIFLSLAIGYGVNLYLGQPARKGALTAYPEFSASLVIREPQRGEKEMRAVHPTTMQRMLEGAANYAAGDRSDPFAYARAMTHIRTGIVGYTAQGEEAFYAADPAQEIRTLPDGREYSATVYRNMKRP